MAKIYTYEWAVGKWDSRASLTYVPIDKDAGGCKVLPVQVTGFLTPEGRVPYKVEDTGSGVIYMTYSSKENAAIIKITEG